MKKKEAGLRPGRVRTPMILQMEAVECGAAALAIILAHHGRIVPLASLRRDCGVSRDGSTMANIRNAALRHGLRAKAFRMDIPALQKAHYPYLVYWNFNHFLVVEGYRKGRVYLNDPAGGRRWVTMEEFDRSYTGIVMTFEKSADFKSGGVRPSAILGLWSRLGGSLVPVGAAVATALLLVIPGLAVPALTETFVDKVLVQGLSDWGRPLMLGMLIATVLRGFIGSMQLRILRRLQIRLAVTQSVRFVRHLLELPASYYAQRYAGEVSSRIVLNDRVAGVLSGRLATASIDVLMMIFYMVVMWEFSHLLTAVAAVFAVVNFGVMQWIGSYRAEGNARLSLAGGKLAGAGVAGLLSIRTLKASALESDFFARWAGFFTNLAIEHQDVMAVNYYIGALPPLLMSLMTVSVLVAGGVEVIHGRMSIGMLVAFQSLATSFLQPVNSLVGLGSSIQELRGDLARLDDVLSSPARPEPPLRGAECLPVRLTGRVEFRNVTFGYSPVTPPIVQDLSFQVLPGQRIAFVGASGSGKSSVARVLAGLYEPTSGEVLFDGIPAGSIPREILANSLAMVDQDLLLFEGTVRDNLTLWDSSTPDENVARACRDAMIDGVIDAMPDGFASDLIEGGRNLSGGQRQRLEIARALAGDPSILILDEATSALDSEMEMLIDRNIRRRGCTCFIVAHRLSTVRDSDEIIVLDQGRVAERGTHEQLVRRGGLYCRLLADNSWSTAA